MNEQTVVLASTDIVPHFAAAFLPDNLIIGKALRSRERNIVMPRPTFWSLFWSKRLFCRTLVLRSSFPSRFNSNWNLDALSSLADVYLGEVVGGPRNVIY